MNYTFAPDEQHAFPPYVRYEGFLSRPECEEIIAVGEEQELGDGTIGNGGNDTWVHDPSYRTVKTRFLQADDERLGWLFKKLERSVLATNRDHYHFALTGLLEGLTFLRYDAGEQPGHYKWHQDFGGGRSSLRKLSIVIQLSPPEDYEGCRLKLFNDMEYEPHGFHEQGDTVIFPSWTPHMVTPLTQGTRYALAVWVSGPAFR